MAEEDVLTATVRDETGSSAARRLRRRGLMPAILYGKETDPVALSVPTDKVLAVVRHGHHMVDLKVGDEQTKALVRQVQYGPFGREVLHLDLVRVSLTDRVRITVPVELRGTARGVELGGVLEQPVHEVEVECVATALPDAIVLRVSSLAVGEALHVRDLELPEGVDVLADPDLVVVHVSEPRKTPEAEAEAEAGPVEPEVITARKPEEEPEREKSGSGG